MAAKFDGKHARANMWVTHQNLARAKGGYPARQFEERKGPLAEKRAAAEAANAAAGARAAKVRLEAEAAGGDSPCASSPGSPSSRTAKD